MVSYPMPIFSCLVPEDLGTSANNIKNAVNGLALARKTVCRQFYGAPDAHLFVGTRISSHRWRCKIKAMVENKSETTVYRQYMGRTVVYI